MYSIGMNKWIKITVVQFKIFAYSLKGQVMDFDGKSYEKCEFTTEDRMRNV